MSDTQNYKILTLDCDSTVELTIAVSAAICKVQIQRERAGTVEMADEYRRREMILSNIRAQLVRA